MRSVAGGLHRLTFVVVFQAALAAASVAGAAVPTGFVETTIASGISGATAMAFAPDGRLFVCEQTGRLRVIKSGSLLPTPFVTLPVDSAGERGLLGVAFDPDFAANQYVYVYYTATTPTVHNRISRFTALGDVAAAGSEVFILDLDDLSSATNHNGGAIHFGGDGKLYAGVGENANAANAQSLSNLLGKVLRINADGTIPTDNPFYGAASGRNRAIWALGLRNPFTFAFNRARNRMFVNDVGASTYEEINEGVAGSNYGWPQVEGPQPPGVAGVRYPLYSYTHAGGGCAIAGGAFYDPAVPQYPASFVGDYFFGDLCAGFIRQYHLATGAVVDFASGISQPVDVQLGPDAALYYLARGTGSVVRITYTAAVPTSPFTAPGIYRPQAATFYLRLSNTTGIADLPPVAYGYPGDVPVIGDWNGDGVQTIGIYRPSESAWYLRNSNTTGVGDMPRILYGLPGDVPIVGDWNGDGVDTIGVYRPRNATFYLRNSNSTGVADLSFVFGYPGDVPLTGDWNGDGTTTVGIYRPSTGQWFLRNSNTTGVADVAAIFYGLGGDLPITGDWNGDGVDTVGVFRPSNATWYLRDSNTTGGHTIPAFVFGTPRDRPVPGRWR